MITRIKRLRRKKIGKDIKTQKKRKSGPEKSDDFIIDRTHKLSEIYRYGENDEATIENM
jgi:hypothetical protein